MLNEITPPILTPETASSHNKYITEVPELQDEERPKLLAPPPTAQTAGPN